MINKEGAFKNTNGIEIYYQCWLPEEEEKAVLLVVHGLGEHCGRYMNLVNYFVPQGYAVYGFDHQGHGKSGGDRLMVKTFDDLTSALSIFHKMVTDWHRDNPLFLLGHSMGGLIASYYLLEHQSAFKGAVMSGPLVKLGDDFSRFTIIMGRILSRFAPGAGVMKLDPSGISRDREVVLNYTSDPLVFHGKTPARLASEGLRLISLLEQAADQITLPIIIVQGGDDRLICPEGAQMFYDKIGSEDKTLKIYPGLYHEVFNEPEKDMVFADIETWLERQLKT